MATDDQKKALPRLAPEFYRGKAYVHWSMTIRDRQTGWLDDHFHLRLRETLTHACFRYGFACPIYCLMPDHLHLMLIGFREESDQRVGIRFLRKHLNALLVGTGHKLQKQAHDHVLRETDRKRGAFSKICHYIRENPVRAGIVEHPDAYPYSGCLLPGYPELQISQADYWDRFWRIYYQP